MRISDWSSDVCSSDLTTERRMERRLIDDYERTVGGLLDALDGGNVDLAAEIAAIPEHVRGYGHVKEAHLHKAKAREAELLAQWTTPLRIVQAAWRRSEEPGVGKRWVHKLRNWGH